MEASIAKSSAVGKGLGHFHHAICYFAAARALMGETDEAIDELRRGADDGFPCYPWFERDPCLESIRGDPRFLALISELKNRWS